MPYRDERYRRRARKRNRIGMIVALALLLEVILLIVLLSRGCSSRRGTPDLTSQQTAPVATETPVPTDTPEPTEVPTPVPTPAPTAQSFAVDGYLPVYRNVKTTGKVKEADGSKGDVKNVENKDNLEAAGIVMLAPGTGKGAKLYQAINSYRERILTMVTDEHQKKIIQSNLSTVVPKGVHRWSS